MNFPSDNYNGNSLSAKTKKLAGDKLNFRVGPARIFQLRKGKIEKLKGVLNGFYFRLGTW